MKRKYILLLLVVLGALPALAQQRLDPKGMNYVVAAKPNSIIYHDTLFSGSKQFSSLFYRTRDQELIRLLEKHQSNKVTGQVLGLIGTIGTIVGIGQLSRSDNKGLAWGLIGGGFAMTLTGGYLTLMGQRNLQMAVILFNQRHNQASLGMGVANRSVGLVYQF
jgi:hypothetical protein